MLKDEYLVYLCINFNISCIC